MVTFKDTYTLNNTDIVTKSSVALLAVEIDRIQNFITHIPTICQKANDKLFEFYLHSTFFGASRPRKI